MAAPLHILSSLGDPCDRKTWSGTPAALVKALAATGPLATHDITSGKALYRLGQLTNLVTGYGARQPMRVGLLHWIDREKAARVLDRIGPGDVLHLGSGHMPPARRPGGQRHFTYADFSAWLMFANPALRAGVTDRWYCATMANERRTLQMLDGVFTTSAYVRDHLIADYGLSPDRVFAVGSGLNRVMPVELDAKDYANGHMLFVAKHNFINKGGHLLLDAFEIVRRQRPSARLVVIGNRQDPLAAPDLARLEGTPGIEFHNWDTPRYEELVRTAALYAGPALDEPWGIIYLESLAVGTPIAGLARNAQPEFAHGGAHGFIAPEATAESYAATLLDALSSPDRLRAMGERGRAHVVAHYQWPAVAERIREALAALPTAA